MSFYDLLALNHCAAAKSARISGSLTLSLHRFGDAAITLLLNCSLDSTAIHKAPHNQPHSSVGRSHHADHPRTPGP
jgi:hypothetical protein